MTFCSRPTQSVAILLSLLITPHAHADMILVSNSPSGPFTSTATLWTQTVPMGLTPSSIELTGLTDPTAFVFSGKLFLPLAGLDAVVGNASGFPVVSQVPYAIQITHGQSKVVLAGEMSSTNFFGDPIFFTNPTIVTIGKKMYDVTLQVIPNPIPDGRVPGATSFEYSSYSIYATVPLDEIARTPEPSSLVLAGIGAAGLAGGAWRRRRESAQYNGQQLVRQRG